MESCDDLRTLLVGIKLNIVADTVCRPKTDHAVGGEKFFPDNLIEQFLCVVEKFACLFSEFFVFKNPRITAVELPCLEEGRPVDEFDNLLEWKVPESSRAEEFGAVDRNFIPIKADPICARIGERDQFSLFLAAKVPFAQPLVVGFDLC